MNSKEILTKFPVHYIGTDNIDQEGDDTSKFMTFGDDTNFEDFSNPKKLVDIMDTYKNDPDKARRMSFQYNKEKKYEFEKRQSILNQQMQKEYDMRVKQNSIVPSSRYLGTKSPYSDPLFETLPNGIIPELPPVPDEISNIGRDYFEEEEMQEYDGNVFMDINPINKAEVGEKFGIQIDMPKVSAPTHFEMTQGSNTTKRTDGYMNSFNPSMQQYDPYGYMMYNYPMTPPSGSAPTKAFTPTQNYPSPYPVYNGGFLNPQEQYNPFTSMQNYQQDPYWQSNDVYGTEMQQGNYETHNLNESSSWQKERVSPRGKSPSALTIDRNKTGSLKIGRVSDTKNPVNDKKGTGIRHFNSDSSITFKLERPVSSSLCVTGGNIKTGKLIINSNKSAKIEINKKKDEITIPIKASKPDKNESEDYYEDYYEYEYDE